MHSQLAQTEHASLNLAPLILLDPVVFLPPQLSNLPNPDGVEVFRAGPQLLDGVPPGPHQLMQARAQVPHVVLEVVLLYRRRVLLEGLRRHLVIVRPILQVNQSIC